MYDICRKCGRRLSDKKSRERGYGPTCWGKAEGIKKPRTTKPEGNGELDGQMSIYDFPEFLPERNNYGGK